MTKPHPPMPVSGAVLLAAPAIAQNLPAAHQNSWTARDFRFANGQGITELRIGYTTLGDAANPAVLVLHGTAGTGAGMLNEGFGGQLFGPGQVLDATRYFIILPDAIGTGRSGKPSDGMGADFPRYSYADMVAAQHALVTQGLGLRRLRMVIGNSMGGMHAWMWGVAHPDMMDMLVPMACQPTEMSSRNWMLRRLMVESIRQDPAYASGRYAAQPASLRMAAQFYAMATNGGTLRWHAIAGTRDAADREVDQRMAAPGPADANDWIWQWDSSRDYNPGPYLERIRARVLAINSADDERNPPETGLMEAALRRIAQARLHLIPASAETLGHGTTGNARFWAEELRRFMA